MCKTKEELVGTEYSSHSQGYKSYVAELQSEIRGYRNTIAELIAENASTVDTYTKALLNVRNNVASQCAEIVAKAEIEHFNAVGLPYVMKPQTPIANTIYKEFGLKELVC